MASGLVLLTTKREVAKFVDAARARGERIGLVPTMGAIHSGHQSLVARALESAQTVVVSVFVNPTQFAPGEDYDAYPRTLDDDVRLLGEVGAAAVFAPSVAEMYGERMVELMRRTGRAPIESMCHPVAGSAAKLWEGAKRPTHFDGVVTVVNKLFNIVDPDLACFGEKDFQQLAVIRQMVCDMDMGIEIIGCPIARDPDGLAISSRNRYMDEFQRARALSLSAALGRAREMFVQGCTDTAAISSEMRSIITAAPAEVDYAEIIDAATLEPLESLEGIDGADARAIIAARVDTTRLIDNASLG